jgi:aminoglycoside/choline kinase family phosphotransferase
MFVDWPRKPDGPAIRDGRPYCDIAHLARDGRSYVTLSRWLREEAGTAAPDVYAADVDRGLYLVEDLGDAVFADLVAAGRPVEELHGLAVDGLLAIRRAEACRAERAREDFSGIRDYSREALEVELELLPRWYFKLAAGQECTTALVRSFFAAWAPFLAWLGRQKSGLVLRDYHSPNLLLRPDREGLSRLGIVDFQDAVLGHPAYDLVSLLQDARVDVPEAIERALFARYSRGIQKLGLPFDAEAFGRAYAILGAQRNTKILGIFARLSLRDGKHGYLGHLPRVAHYLLRNLTHPDLAPLKAWYEAHLFDRPSHRPSDGGSWHTPNP